MSTKDIRPTDAYTVCDICGRTLLRGERAEVFLNGGQRRSVCELCKSRALHEGWVREGAIPEYEAGAGGSDRRRPLLGRLRRRPMETGDGSLDDALSGDWGTPPDTYGDPPAAETSRSAREESRSSRRSSARRARADRSDPMLGSSQRGPAREPRHVRAVPSSEDQKIVSVLDMFNRSEHPRTVSGVARSLGSPTVAVLPDPVHPTVARVVVSWELCWYRYEIDLAEAVSSIRLDGQGYELSELTEPERMPNAVADENGQLKPL